MGKRVIELIENTVGRPGSSTPCVLMFSGGRDSTLAAVRLAERGYEPVLVTITSNHLTGIAQVRERLRELAPHLPPGTRWLRIAQPTAMATDMSFYAQTCLPCHHAYVVVAVAVAKHLGAGMLAFGYTGYQSDWPEQTPKAVASMRRVLDENGIGLALPVHDLTSREDAQTELARLHLSPAALEQKCSRQITNVKLDDGRLEAQVALWEQAIRESLDKLELVSTNVEEDITLERLAA